MGAESWSSLKSLPHPKLVRFFFLDSERYPRAGRGGFPWFGPLSLYKDVRRATHACTWGHHLMHGFDGSRVRSAHVHTWVVREIRTNRDASITRAYDT